MTKREELNEVLKGTHEEIQDFISKQPPGPLPFDNCSCPSIEEKIDLMKNYGYQITCSSCRRRMDSERAEEDLGDCIIELKSVVSVLLAECIKEIKEKEQNK